ncbi:MAG: hypothetical protein KatS3mg068_1657 [Candidatus Sericytochromatia bacterium]|nr:MAG: hypothetical protein KatS3mg068_1657 [Candidatus Sericytochromatia bacterium]
MTINYKLIPFLLLAIFNIVIGILIGLYRSGWQINFVNQDIVYLHGPIMINGFLLTLINLERTVAIRKKVAFIGAFLSGISFFLLFLEVDQLIIKFLILLSSFNLIFIYLYALKIDKEIHIYIQIMGTCFLIIGNILWIYNYYFTHISLWWISFLLFTISGERLELSKLKNFSNTSKKIFILSILLTTSSLFLSFYSYNISTRILGISFFIIMLWFFKYDIALNMLKNNSLTRFIAICIINGYLWLGISSMIIIINGQFIIGNFLYDAFLHSFFLGFVISMIFAHAPIIFPAILRIKINYSHIFYTHLVFLNISIITRIIADIMNLYYLLKISTILNSMAILLFLINTLISIKINYQIRKDVINEI